MRLNLSSSTFFLLLVLLVQCSKDNPDKWINIPDENFINALVSMGIDTDGDGRISSEEAKNINSLDISGRGISDITGIEKFDALDTLICYNNQLNELDVSDLLSLKYLDCRGCGMKNINLTGCTDLEYLNCGFYQTSAMLIYNFLTDIEIADNLKLKYLWMAGNLVTEIDLTGITALKKFGCPGNKLTSLDISGKAGLDYLDCTDNVLDLLNISGDVALQDLKCANNRLTTIDLSDNLVLSTLDCSGNQLTDLDISANSAMNNLYCGENNLTAINVSSNPELDWFSCPDNLLTGIDVSDNFDLSWLDCSQNQLTGLDVTKNTNLKVLWCRGNQLTTIDISGNIYLGLGIGGVNSCFLDIRDMPALEKVCVWALPFPPEDFRLCRDGSPNVYFTTECSN